MTVGGGIGLFRDCRLSAHRRRADVGHPRPVNLDHPWQTYEYLTRVSQIPQVGATSLGFGVETGQHLGLPVVRRARGGRQTRRRSAAVAVLGRADLRRLLDAAGRAGLREPGAGSGNGSATSRCCVNGRRTDGAASETAAATSPSSPRRRGRPPTKRVAYRSRFVHVAVGYPGAEFLPDLQDYREQVQRLPASGQRLRAARAGLRDLLARPGTVVVRGGGIVASRVLQRLMDDRESMALRRRSCTSSAPT